jgi:hypothetical protein
LLPKVFPNSEITNKFPNVRTKSIALIKTVMIPFTVAKILKLLSFYNITMDASHHSAEKISPWKVFYFIYFLWY